MTGSSSEEVVLVAEPGSAAVRGGLEGGVAVRGCDILEVLWGCSCTYLRRISIVYRSRMYKRL